MTINDQDIESIRASLNELRIEHRDLDIVITRLIEHPDQDELLIRRMKKRKLQIKDKIDLLERMLVPDIPA